MPNWPNSPDGLRSYSRTDERERERKEVRKRERVRKKERETVGKMKILKTKGVFNMKGYKRNRDKENKREIVEKYSRK